MRKRRNRTPEKFQEGFSAVLIWETLEDGVTQSDTRGGSHMQLSQLYPGQWTSTWHFPKEKSESTVVSSWSSGFPLGPASSGTSLGTWSWLCV